MPTLGQPIPQSADSIAFEGGYDPSSNTMGAKQLDSVATANGTTYGPQVVVMSAKDGYIAAAGSQPTATGVGADTSWSFAQKVNHILIQNNTGANVQFDLDQAATAGSPNIPAGATYFLDVKVTAVHLLTAAAQNINGVSSGNIVIRGWL